MNTDETNGVRADTFEMLLNRLAGFRDVRVRPMVSVIVQHGTCTSRIEIEDAEIRVNLPNIDEFLKRKVEDALDLVHYPFRRKDTTHV